MLTHPKSFEEWRSLSRSLIQAGISPQEVVWQEAQQVGLFGEVEENQLFKLPQKVKEIRVSKAFFEIAKTVSCHRSGEQWALLYSLFWRMLHGERHLLQLDTDREVMKVKSFVKNIRRDLHKMRAFVRFKKVGECEISGREQFIAWFEPEHRIVGLTTTFFKRRFGGMDWSILTPDDCVHWNGSQIWFSEGVDRSQAPSPDAQDELWKSYYKSIFNPARLKTKAMQSEMPKKYWKNLPEAELIEGLVRSSQTHTQGMLHKKPSPKKKAPQNQYLESLKILDLETCDEDFLDSS